MEKLMNKLVRPIALTSLLLVAGHAAADGFALGAKVSTLGLGLEGTTRLSDSFNLRGGINSYSRDFDETVDDIRYNADLDLKSAALLVDWHPFAGTFRVSAGLLHNKNEASLTATPTSDVTIGSRTYTPSEVGTLSGDVKFKKSAPYLGVGWGNAVSKANRFGFTAEIGALFQGKPDVTLRSSNASVNQADLQREEQDFENQMDDFKVYPVLSIGFSYRF